MKLIALLSYFLVQSHVNSWQTYKSLPEADIFFKLEQCHDNVNGIHREYVLLKFVNKTNNRIKLSWNMERYEADVCTTCNKDEYKYSLELDPNQSVEGECATHDKKLSVFVKHLDLPNAKPYSKFELGSLTVTTL